MGFFRSVTGMVEAELTSADPHGTLRRISGEGIRLYRVQPVNDLTYRFQLSRGDYKKAKQLTAKRGDSFGTARHIGLYWTLKRLRHRKILVIGLLLVILLSILLPRRILFVQVEGNTGIPAALIAEAAKDCGISFGASRREVRSEKMKNGLLAAIPQLQWAGINTKGCVALISVREKTAAEEKLAEPPVSRIIASRDAVIVSCTVERGNMVCRIGQAVKAGELLVSGYTDCGLSIKATRSVGEIYGQTSRDLSAVTPEEYAYKGAKKSREKKYALIIGKKRINFYKDSGILGDTCGKMSTVNYLGLPGGFELPVALVTEEWIRYDSEVSAVSDHRAEEILGGFADDYLTGLMLAGRVLGQDLRFCREDGVVVLRGKYACLEMIGREQSEEILENYGKID